MKSLTTKLFAFMFIIALAAGCGSVTDANLEAPQPDQPEIEQVSPDQIDDPGFGTEQTQDPIYDKPK